MNRDDIIEWAAELAAYIQKHPVHTRTLDERIWGLVGTRFNQDELDCLVEHVEQRLQIE